MIFKILIKLIYSEARPNLEQIKDFQNKELFDLLGMLDQFLVQGTHILRNTLDQIKNLPSIIEFPRQNKKNSMASGNKKTDIFKNEIILLLDDYFEQEKAIEQSFKSKGTAQITENDINVVLTIIKFFEEKTSQYLLAEDSIRRYRKAYEYMLNQEKILSQVVIVEKYHYEFII